MKWVIFSALAGVLLVFSAKALNVTVPPGGNLQTAINQVNAAGGGSVILQAGTYTNSVPLNLLSFVTLTGQGPSSTTITNSGFSNVIQQAGEGLASVTIENLRVTGKHTNTCYGILLQALSTYHTNIVITNVEVTGCGMGVHLKRVCGVIVAGCDFHDNGTTYTNDFYYFHNLYIRQCDHSNDNIMVTNCQLNHGWSGNGLNLSYDYNIFVENSTATNNFFRGMRTADSTNFTVQFCTLSGNGDAGLIANQEAVPTRNIDWHANAARNNLNGGFVTTADVTGSATANDACGNAPSDYDFVSSVTQSGNTTCGSVPAAPAGLAALAGSAQVNLHWTATSGATSYNVNRSLVSGGPYPIIASTITTTNYTDTGLTNGVVYFYTVSANNAVGAGPDSAQVSARPVSLIPPLLNLVFVGGQWQLSWPADHLGWRLQVQTNPLASGLGTNWSTVANSTNFNQTSIPIMATSGSLFLRLAYP